KDLGTVFPERELLAPAGSGSFAWSGPAWAWTQAAPAGADAKAGLQAAVESLWKQLDSQAGKPLAAGAAASMKASMKDFVQASELRGRPYTGADELLQVAAAQALPGDKAPEAFLKDEEARARSRDGQRARDDERGAHPPVARRADGSLPPRLALRPLASLGELRVQLLAGGRLARLTDAGGEPVIQFQSNYHDGPRGRGNTVRYMADPWFRRNAAGQWELDAIYPTQAAHQVLDNAWPQEVLEQLPY
uniref:hypothetical protein n=1 Tax=Pelomonas sp. KK5 TaxID=1855730 RepID=UPI001301FFE4